VPDRRHCPGTLLRLVHRGRSTPDGVLDVHLPCDHAVVTIFSVHIFPDDARYALMRASSTLFSCRCRLKI
jgi:hypothetical protein